MPPTYDSVASMLLTPPIQCLTLPTQATVSGALVSDYAAAS